MDNKTEYTVNDLLDMYINGDINDQELKDMFLLKNNTRIESDSNSIRMAKECGAYASLVTILLLEMKYPTNRALLNKAKKNLKHEL